MTAVAAVIEVKKFLIDGEWKESGSRLEVRNPYGGTAGAVFLATESDVEDAITSSIRGFKLMKSLPSYKRAEMLKNIADRIKERKEEFARLITLEAGKPIKDSRGEVDRAIMTFTLASEEAKRVPGDAIPLDLNQASEGRVGLVQRFPIGPVLGITPFNFPLNLVAHKVAPALAAGNSIILKPSERTPLTSLLLGEVVLQAGVPAGALNVIPCSTALAEKMVGDERIKAVTFTGSTAVGWKLKSIAGKKRVILELGGNAAVIVDSDVDISAVATRCSVGAYSYAGQSCISVQRIYVHRSKFDEFIQKFVDLVKHKKVGDPMEEDTDVGPVINEEAAIRIEQWVNEAVEGGARILTGGHRNGTIYEPTVLTGVNPKDRISCLEAFGPVSIVEPFDDFQEVIDKVNDSDYGLQTGVFSNNLEHVFHAFRELEVGQVIVNDVSSYRIDHMPYGGVKDSGFGREGVRYTIEELTDIKMLAINPM
jgi:acyl-CoA reductase-like NAD-dependent aldehyde dehydrogenase